MPQGTGKGGTAVTTKHVGLDFYFYEKNDGSGATVYFGRADGVGIDVVFRSGVSGAEITWDESLAKWIMDGVDIQLQDSDELRFGDLAAGDIVMNFDSAKFELEGAAANTSWDIGKDSKNINITQKGTLTVGKNDVGHDVIFYGASTGKLLKWDESADELDITATLEMQTNERIQLRDTGLYMYSSADAQLDLVSDGVIKLNGKRTLMAPLTEALSGAKTLSVNATRTQFLDPDGAGRTVTLPITASSAGFPIVLVNKADAAETITVIDASANTIGTIDQDEIGIFFCDGTSWEGGVLKET